MTLGEKLSEFVSKQLGTWKFVFFLSAATAFWITWNTHSPRSKRFDPYPFVALNLCYSFLAGYTAPILLMSASRQAELDRKRSIENLEIDRMDHAHIHAMLHKIKAIEEDIESAMKLRPETSKTQPDWVCDDCGREWGRWWDGGAYSGPAPHFSTHHIDTCDVCKKTKSVTEARDYGFLRKGWDRLNP